MENQTLESQPVPSPGETPQAPEIDPLKLAQFEGQIKDEQNLLAAVIAGGVAALVSAIIWAMITVITEYQVGWMAVGVGFLVGISMRLVGKGVDRVFGILGASLSLVGCLVGNLLSAVGFIAKFEAVPLLDVLTFFVLTPVAVIEVMVFTFEPIDLLFYAIAVYMGYKYSFRGITKAELESLYRVKPEFP